MPRSCRVASQHEAMSSKRKPKDSFTCPLLTPALPARLWCMQAVITTRILQLVHELCTKRIHVTKRDLFYTGGRAGI